MLKKLFSGDRWLLILPIFLSIFGLVMIFDSSAVSAINDFSDKFHYFKLQLSWFVIGLIGFVFFSWLPYQKLKKIALPAFLFTLILLVLVLIPGVGKEVLGGRRWISIAGIGMQPAELVKLTLVIYLSTLFEKRREFLPFLLLIGLVFGLLLLEPDLGTATIIILTSLAIYFVSEAPIKHFAYMFFLMLVVGPIAVFSSSYRRQRLSTFLNSSVDINGASYHIRQVLIALGSGGFWGRGLGQSKQKFLFLPEVTTDSIFAVIAEETGFLGAIILIGLFIFLIMRGLKVATNSNNGFGKMLGSGLVFLLGFQVLVNISAMVSLVPLTGVPLPFISYGGSSLVIFLSSMGILYNISKK